LQTRVDVFLVPEIDGLKDTTVIPYETIQFEVLILSNPKPKVTWRQGDVEIKNCEHTQLIADIEAEVYRLVITNIGLGDDGVFTVTACNSQGESTQQCVLHVHSKLTLALDMPITKKIDFLTQYHKHHKHKDKVNEFRILRYITCHRTTNLELITPYYLLYCTICLFTAEVPSFATAIQDQTIKAYHDVDFRVRVNGVPKPHIKW
jgi:hypothetical protein